MWCTQRHTRVNRHALNWAASQPCVWWIIECRRRPTISSALWVVEPPTHLQDLHSCVGLAGTWGSHHHGQACAAQHSTAYSTAYSTARHSTA